MALRGSLSLLALSLLTLPCRLQGHAPPVLLNLTGSAPLGLYRRLPRSARVGDAVAACLPSAVAGWARERSYVGTGQRCPAGTRPVLKHLAATAGAWVERTPGGLVVDGVPQPRSRALEADREGRPVVVAVSYPYRVGRHEVLLLNPHPDSFDGRYFGPVAAEAVLAAYAPWWTGG
jgi:conjugative transfer signal peptidase TraF